MTQAQLAASREELDLVLEVRRAVQRVSRRHRLESLDPSLEFPKVVLVNLHVRLGIEHRNPVGEPLDHLVHRPLHPHPALDAHQLLGRVYAHGGQRIHLGQRHLHHPRLQIPRRARPLVLFPLQRRLTVPVHRTHAEAPEVSLAGPPRVVRLLLDVEHDVDQILGSVPLVLDDDAPLGRDRGGGELGDAAVLARACRLLRDLPRVPRAHLDAPANLKELEGVIGVIQPTPSFAAQHGERVAQVNVFLNLRLVGHDNRVPRRRQLGALQLELGNVPIGLELLERPLDEPFALLAPLHSHQVQQHRIVQPKRGVERVGPAVEHALGDLRVHALVHHQHDEAAVVQAASSRASGHLNVLPGRYPSVSKLCSIVLPRRREDHRPARHVEPRGHRLRGNEHLDEPLLEQNLDHLLEHRQQTGVVKPDSSLDHGEYLHHLRQVLVLRRELRDGRLEYGVDHALLRVAVEVQSVQRLRLLLDHLLVEREHDARVVVLVRDHLHDFVNLEVLHLLPLTLAVAASAAARLRPVRGLISRVPVRRGGDGVDRLEEVILPELVVAVKRQVDAVAALGEDVMLKGRRAIVRVHEMARVAVRLDDPLGELLGVGDRRREEHVSHGVRKEVNRLFPDDAALEISHVMNLVEDDPTNLAHDLAAAVQHRAKHLRGHDETRRALVDDGVAGHQAHVAELVLELPELLVGERLERGRVDDALAVSERHRDGVLGHDGLPRGSMRGDHHALALFHHLDRFLLERVQSEGVHLGGILLVVDARVGIGRPTRRTDDVVETSVRRGVRGGYARPPRGEHGLDVVLRLLQLDLRPRLEQRLDLVHLLVEESGARRGGMGVDGDGGGRVAVGL